MDAISTLTKSSEDTSHNTCPLLVFQVSDQYFALNVQCLDQVILMLQMTRPPHLNPMIEGIANIHGKAVPVINARRCFGLPEREVGLYTPIILANASHRRLGLIVDEVVDVFQVPEESITAPSAIFPEGMENPMVTSMVYHEGRSILVLDLDFLLHPSEFALAESLSSGNKNGNEHANGKKHVRSGAPKKSSASPAGINETSV